MRNQAQATDNDINVIYSTKFSWRDKIKFAFTECAPTDLVVANGSPVPLAAPFLEGDTIGVECDTGFVLDKCGCTGFICQADGTWEGEATCVPTCK